MGKGDIKTRRGKLFRGTYGKRRPAKKTTITGSPKPAKPGTKKQETKVSTKEKVITPDVSLENKPQQKPKEKTTNDVAKEAKETKDKKEISEQDNKEKVEDTQKIDNKKAKEEIPDTETDNKKSKEEGKELE